ncbi:MAG: isopenicillin N synthase family oxygenase [Proteobacteria bacterium]|nr:isopenicillin N synthase family oxygenase [Pseudomonadota bacterium]
MAGIPVVDFRDFSNPERRASFVATLGKGLEEFGFVAVTGHGVSPELLAQAYAVAEQTFALPHASKASCEDSAGGRQRGYTSFGVEHAKDQAVPDLKEFWHIGRQLPDDHPLTLSGDIPANRFPDDQPDFGPTFLALFDALEGFANGLLEAVGEHLDLPEDFFRNFVRDGNSVLRVIHYPDMGPDAPPEAVRAAQHEDINLMTVLPASTRPGLELLTRDGEWMAVQTPPDVMVCDTGDMMQLLTGGRLPATTHRVVNPPDSDGGRYSMPFFLHPHPDQILKPMQGDEPGITTREYLHERLVAIGVA